MADRVMRDLLEQCAQHCRVSQAVESSSSTLQSMQTELNSITNIAGRYLRSNVRSTDYMSD